MSWLTGSGRWLWWDTLAVESPQWFSCSWGPCTVSELGAHVKKNCSTSSWVLHGMCWLTYSVYIAWGTVHHFKSQFSCVCHCDTVYCDEFLLDSFIVDLAFSRFYDPQEGLILVGGRDLKHLDVSWWRKQIGLVSQQPMLFDMTLEERFRAYGAVFGAWNIQGLGAQNPLKDGCFLFFVWGGGPWWGEPLKHNFLFVFYVTIVDE